MCDKLKCVFCGGWGYIVIDGGDSERQCNFCSGEGAVPHSRAVEMEEAYRDMLMRELQCARKDAEEALARADSKITALAQTLERTREALA